MSSAFFIHLAILIGVYVIVAVSYNIALGYTGLLNLSHVAFFGIGAYTSALLALQGLPYLLALLVGATLAAVSGLFLVYATNNVRGDYLALATLGFNYVVYSVMMNWTGVTRGPLGIPGIPRPSFFGVMIGSDVSYLIFAFLVALVSVLMMWRVAHSRFGRLLEAVRDNPTGLVALGKNVFRIKAQGMMISAFFAGVAGSVYAHYISYIDPAGFTLMELVLVLTMVVVGGLASIRGSILGAVIILLIPEVLRFIAIPASVLGPARQIIYALVLILILLYRPRGLFGRVDLA